MCIQVYVQPIYVLNMKSIPKCNYHTGFKNTPAIMVEQIRHLLYASGIAILPLINQAKDSSAGCMQKGSNLTH